MRIGLSNVVYSVMDDTTDISGGTISYGTVYPLPGAVSLTFDRGASIANIFADDGSFVAGETVGEMKIGLECADLLPADYARLLGFAYASGMIAEGIADVSPFVAIGFKTRRLGKNSGADIFDYVWLPKCIFQKPKMDEKTKDKSLAPRTMKLDGEALRTLSNDKYIVRARSDDSNVAAATLSGWFNQPLYSATQSLTAVTLTSAAGSISGKTVTFTMAKSGESFAIDANTLNDKNVHISVVSTGLLLAGTNTFSVSAAGIAPTFTLANANIAGVAYLVTVDADVKDSNGVPVTAKSVLVTPA
jgi:phi13 family phage major tail protein